MSHSSQNANFPEYVPPVLPGNERQGKIEKVKSTIDSSIDTMRDNMVKMIERGNQIDSLLDKSADLNETSEQFHYRSRAVERREFYKKWGTVLFILLACIGLLVVFYFISLPLFIVTLIVMIASFTAYFWWMRRGARVPMATRMAVFRRVVPTGI